MLKRIYEYVFYNPSKVAERHQNINLDATTVLLKTTRFQLKGNQNSVNIKKNTMVGCSFVFESERGEVSIGENTFINGGTSLISRTRIEIGNNVTIAWGCTIYDHNSHSLDYKKRREDIAAQLKSHRAGKSFIDDKNWNTVKSTEIAINNDVWIGFGCTILSGVTIGEGAIVGAQSVVREDVEPWTVVAGNPAVILKRLK